MSYILDALKRAEQQRGAPARGAASLPRAMATDFEPRARWPWIVGGGVSVAALAVVIAFWPAREVATPEATVARAPAPVATPRATPIPAVVSSAPPAALAPPSPRAVPAPPSPARAVGAPPAPRVAPPRPAVPGPGAVAHRAATPAMEDRRAERRVAPSPAPRPTPRLAERAPTPPPVDIARATRPPATDSQPAPPAAPAGELKALTAKLSIQVLSWAPERKDRFVFLGGHKYGEGQMVDGKILVEQITEEGVVLSYQGERLMLKGR
jgi:general secretion pathway protein B